jgi:PAS domain S-box-containing protein
MESKAGKDGSVMTSEESKRRPVPVPEKRRSRSLLAARPRRRLRAGEEPYRTIFDNAQVGLFRTRAADGRVLAANSCLARMFGYSDRRRLVEEGLASRHYLDPADRLRMVAIARREGEVRNFETGLSRLDGTPFWVRFSCRYLAETDILEGVMVDITDLREFEEAMKRAKEELESRVAERTAELHAVNCKLMHEMAARQRAAEEALLRQRQLVQADKMASLGVLLTGVAHEVNNPTGLLLLNLPLLRDAFADAVAVLEERCREQGDFPLGGVSFTRMREELPRLLEESLEGARQIRRIVQDLKTFARTSEPPRMEAVDLNEVVQAAVRLAAEAIRKATDRFRTDYGEGLPKLRGNAQRIEQVVVNLLLNACQALPGRDRGVGLATWHDPESGRVVLEVRDEGVGIAEADLPRLTDPFFTTRRELGGTGLGLSVSAGIVQEHGGALRFRSRPGEGTVVTLELPAWRE